MLAGLRKVTRGWVAGVFIALLAGSFALFGVNDVFRGGSSTDVATGEGVTVSGQELQETFERVLESQRAENPQLTRADAIEQNAPREVLRQLISVKSLLALAERLDFAASDAAVARAIRENEAFRNQVTRSFDMQVYRSRLADNGYTEARFERDQRRDLVLSQLAALASTPVKPPRSFTQLAFDLETEERVISLAEIGPQLVAAPPPPTEAELQAFYQENINRFQQPERRSLTIILARAGDFAAKAEIPEEKVRELFEFRKDTLTEPATRSFVQVTAPDKASAEEAARRLARGEEVEAVAAAVGGQAVTFGEKTQADLPDAKVASAVFARQAGETTAAIEGDLGVWAAARVTSAKDGETASFSSVREQLRAELAQEEANALMSAAVEKFEDSRAAGEDIVSAAAAAGLQVVEAARIDAQGRTPTGETPPNLDEDLLRAAFAAGLSDVTDFVTSDEGYSLARVDDITPAGPEPLEKIRPQLEAFWRGAKIGEGMRAIAESIKTETEAGKPFAEVVRAKGANVVALDQKVTRTMLTRSPAPALSPAVFGGREGEAVVVPLGGGQALAVAFIQGVEKPSPEERPGALAQAEDAMTQSLGGDLQFALQSAAVSAAKVRTNETLYEQLYGAQPEAGAEPAA